MHCPYTCNNVVNILLGVHAVTHCITCPHVRGVYECPGLDYAVCSLQTVSNYHTSTANLRTLNQIIRKGPVKSKPKTLGPLNGNPQLKGVILQVFTRKPKKPNSAQRKCCRVRLSNGKEVTAYIPGGGHTLQEHNVVLVEGGRTQDLPGVKVKVVRGKYDCTHPIK